MDLKVHAPPAFHTDTQAENKAVEDLDLEAHAPPAFHTDTLTAVEDSDQTVHAPPATPSDLHAAFEILRRGPGTIILRAPETYQDSDQESDSEEADTPTTRHIIKLKVGSQAI